MSISIKDLLTLSNPTIIDIRNTYYYNMGHIKGSINIPYYKLLNNYTHYLTKDETYYIYCDIGDKSSELTEKLNNIGYNIINIEGGYLTYSRLK